MTTRRAILIGCLLTNIPAFAFGALIYLRLFVFGISRIPQNGMDPNLPAGTRVVTRLHAYDRPEDIRRGDLLVFWRVVDGLRYKYIWRVVGLPGELIETRDGRVSVNAAPAKYVNSGEADTFREQIGSVSYEIAIRPSEHRISDVSVRVPPRHFFVLGDNRGHAADSRDFGCIAFEAVAGKVVWWW